MKRCPRCETVKPDVDFYFKPKRHDGLSGHCISCELAAGKESLRKLYLEVVEHLGGACTGCGYDVPGPALQIDHVNGGGHVEMKATPGHRKLYRRVLAATPGTYQLHCANCNIIKRVRNAEHRPRETYRRVQPVERRPTRRRLSEAEVLAAMDLVKAGGLTQREAAARYGITQSTLSQHITRRRLRDAS